MSSLFSIPRIYKNISIFIIIVALGSVVAIFLRSAEAASFTVDSILDTGDFLIGDAVCDTDDSVGDGPCTLRAALEEANNDPTLDLISFAISGVGPHTITATADFPAIITGPVVIDGSTQTGASCATHTLKISIDFNGFNGFNFLQPTLTGGATVRGLNMYGVGASHATLVLDSDGNTIECNHIGTNITGTAIASSPNLGYGITVSQDTNQIGGSSFAQANIISGNYCNGISVVSGDGLTIEGNYVGTDVTGLTALGNEDDGIVIAPVGTISNVTIDGNVISGNGTNTHAQCSSAGNYSGIRIDDNVGTIGDITLVDNIIGLGSDGSTSLGNAFNGITITDVTDSADILIGGTTIADRNIISANGSTANDAGISVSGTGTSTVVTISGNYIGLDATGVLPRPNSKGVNISSSDGVIIGGSTAGSENLISGNTGDGIIVSGFSSPSHDNSIQGNTIGIDAAGDPLGNGGNGITAALDVEDLSVGGDAAGEGNTIAYNDGAGMYMMEVTTLSLLPVRVSVLGNSIYDNAELGIDLVSDTDANFIADSSLGVTTNDSADSDLGTNDFLNFPVITAVTGSINGLMVDYTLDAPAGDYRIEFFDNTAIDGSGNGEGEVFLTFDTITHTGSGSESFTHSFVPSVILSNIVATTTEDMGSGIYGSTSEFGAATNNENVLPAVTITSTEISPTSASPIPVTITFSEDVTNFVSGDITLGGGTLSNFVVVNPAEYTFDLTPVAEGALTVSVSAGVAQDYFNNDNTASSLFSIVYEAPSSPVATTHNSSSGSSRIRALLYNRLHKKIISKKEDFAQSCIFPKNLKPGDIGYEVVDMQYFLMNLGFPTLVLDGKYGTETTEAVRVFQTNNPQIYKDAGLDAPTGWFYDSTRKHAEEMCTNA